MFKALTAYFQQYKMYAYIAIVIAAFIAGCALTYKATQGTVATLKAKITTLDASLTACQAANAESKKTIDRMKSDRDAAAKTCENQLAIERRESARLRKINETKGGNDEQPSGGGVDQSNTGGSGRSDALLDLLNGYWMLPAGGGDDSGGICRAKDTGIAPEARMVPGTIRYYFCSDDDVRNLLKNWEMQQARMDKCLTILDGLRSAQTATGK